ncbi:hypothetical protein [Segnochrobactrum spirostomi]|uniref:Peptidase A2 domain-containing protein n=1 Tax=Segnochrobactrum spirostomi TaxID=2608987 RepID=A0A6A7XYY3_9HYPH|nr:hypothetical protein [Segnochrobactrum spirostomi]MQT11904.1 hypothetical protein [Segnochrobactrum spirostomi]
MNKIGRGLNTFLAALGVSAGLLGFAVVGPAVAAEPTFEAGAPSVFLPYFRGPEGGEPLKGEPHLAVVIGGKRTRVVMDSGSTGLVLSANHIPGIDNLQVLGPAKLTYSSSGQIMVGRWVVTPVTILGADGTSVQTKAIPVLAVDRVECMPDARRCEPNDSPSRIGMLGIGFGREHDHQPESKPKTNALLNLEGNVHPGYVMTRTGVWVGLDAERAKGFSFVKLERDAANDDWHGAPGCIIVADRQPACGSILVDTGLKEMFMTVPPAASDGLTRSRRGGETLAPGTKVTIEAGPPGQPAARYSFDVGEHDSPMAPARIVLVGGDRPNFVNTGSHFLNGFDMLYDAAGGYVGYRPAPLQ